MICCILNQLEKLANIILDDDIILVDSPKKEMPQINVVDLAESQQNLTIEAYQSKIMENNYAKVEMKSIIQPIREKQMQEDDELQCTGGGDMYGFFECFLYHYFFGRTSTAKRKKKHHCTSCSHSFKTKIGLQDHIDKLHIQDISMFDKLSDIVSHVVFLYKTIRCMVCLFRA